MGSWSNLANLAKNNTPSNAKKAATMQSFEQFKKQAKEKEERVSLSSVIRYGNMLSMLFPKQQGKVGANSVRKSS